MKSCPGMKIFGKSIAQSIAMIADCKNEGRTFAIAVAVQTGHRDLYRR
jgi:hypothetical protein